MKGKLLHALKNCGWLLNLKRIKNMERTGIITFQGSGLTLLGEPVEVGQTAKNFSVINNELGAATLEDYKGNICIISSVPSLDTSVCSIQTKRFNDEAVNLGDDVKILTISMDLPFAQARWCGAMDVENVVTLSDYKDADFGMKYGVLIKELRLLSRAVFVVDKDGVITYSQIVPEITNEPNYEEVLAAVKKLQ